MVCSRLTQEPQADQADSGDITLLVNYFQRFTLEHFLNIWPQAKNRIVKLVTLATRFLDAQK